MQPVDPRTYNWCWAATAASIRQYYSKAAVLQCQVAGSVLNDAAACADPRSADRAWYLERALFRVAVFAGMQDSPRPIDSVAAQLASAPGLPVACRVQWFGGGGAHFVVITAAAPETNKLRIDDPLNGRTDEIDYDEFATNYQGSGTWTDTFLTTPTNTAPLPPDDAPPGGRRQPLRQRAQVKRPLSKREGEIPIYVLLPSDALAGNLDAAVHIGYRRLPNRVGEPLADRYGDNSAYISTVSPITDVAVTRLSQGLAPRSSVRFLEIPAIAFRALWFSVEPSTNMLVPLEPSRHHLSPEPEVAKTQFGILRPTLLRRIHEIEEDDAHYNLGRS